MKKILMFTYLQRHLKKMLPLISVLKKDSQIELTVLLMTQEEEQIAVENNIHYEMLDKYTENKRTMDFDLGWGIAPLTNALDSLSPDLFIAIEVNYILRNAIRYCKQKAIPNLVLQHGTPNEYSLHAFVPFEGECFAAWGEFSKEFLVKNYIDPTRVVVTGGIPFDRTLALSTSKESIAMELGLDINKKWIVFATQPNGPGNRPSMKEIVNSIVEVLDGSLNYDDVEVIIQVHPHQDVEIIKKIADVVPQSKPLITRYRDTEQLIASSDGLITFFSTTAIDAVLLRKPLMLINLIDQQEFFPFVSMGVAHGVYEQSQIKPIFHRMIVGEVPSPENYIKAANYMNYQNDGRALERVIQLCINKLKL